MTFPIYARLRQPQYGKGSIEFRRSLTAWHFNCLKAWRDLETHMRIRRSPCGCFKPTAVRFTEENETHIIECELGARLLREFQEAEALMLTERALIEQE